MAEPGWYDDPQGGGGQRWWDGQRWSEHTTPPPAATPPSGVIPPPPPGAPAHAAAGGSATTPSPAAGRGGKGGGAGKVIAIILVLLLVAAIAAVVVGGLFVLRGDGSSDVGVTVTDGEISEAIGSIAAGDERAFQVPDDGEWELEVEVPAGLLVIDVRGEDDFDPVVELLDADGQQIERNDDRSSEERDRYGGGIFDSLIEREVQAGTYRVVVSGFASQGGPGQVSFPVVGG